MAQAAHLTSAARERSIAAMTGDYDSYADDDLVLLPAPRTQGRAQVEVTSAYVRDLQADDLALLTVERGVQAPSLKRIRDTHHALARALAGGMKDIEIAALYSYSQSRISILKADPAFQHLVEMYRDKVDVAFQATAERMSGLAGDFVAELNERLEADPEGMSNSFVLEAVKVLADRTGNGPQTKNLNVNVNVDLASRLKAARERAGLIND